MNTLDEQAKPPFETQTRVVSEPHGRVIVAEDDRILRDLVVAALRKRGYDVVAARSGVDLLRLVEERLTDGETLASGTVILSDIRMPQMDGLCVLQKLRSLGWGTPIILMTAFGDGDTHAQARQYGATAVLDKPFSMNAMLAAIAEALSIPGACTAVAA